MSDSVYRISDPYVAGEIPLPLSYVFTDSGGAPVDLSAYESVWFSWTEKFGPGHRAAALITNAASGSVMYEWAEGDLDTPGSYRSQFWVEDDHTNRLASADIRFTVETSVDGVAVTGTPLPGQAAGGDLSGLYPNPSVIAVNGVAVTGTPNPGDVLTATGADAAHWVPSSGSGSTTPAYVFDITAYGALGDAQVVSDGAATSGQSSVTCNTSKPFTAAHIGMRLGIIGAGPANQGFFSATILSVANAGATANLSAAVATTVSSARVIWGTNAYAAVRAAATAAETYIAAGHTYAQVWVPPGANVVDGPLDTSKSGNGQVVFGPDTTTAVKKLIRFSGVKGSSAVRHWEQLVPQFGGSCLISFGVYANSTAQTNDINANGNPGVISGPNEGTSNGLAYGASARFSNVMAVIDDLAILTAHSPAGLTYGAANLYGCANAHVEDFAYGTAGTYASGDYGNPNTFAAGLSIGLLMPANGNNDHSVMRNVSCGGGYTYGAFLPEHTLADRMMILYSWAGVCPVGSYAGSVGASHALKVIQASVEGCTHEVYFIGPGAQGVTMVDIDQLQTENGAPSIDGNSAGALAAAVGRIKFTGLFTPDSITTALPTGLDVVNGQVPRAIRIVAADYTVKVIDRTIICTSSSGTTVHLPNADFYANELVIKNVGSGSVTVAALTSPQQHLWDSSQVTTLTVAAGAVARLQSEYNGVEWAWYKVGG